MPLLLLALRVSGSGVDFFGACSEKVNT